MRILISNTVDVPIYLQIAEQIKTTILSGELKGGDGLPSIRRLAADLKISVITTKRAYEELEKNGFLYSRAGKGFYVAEVDQPEARANRRKEVFEHLQKAVDRARLLGIPQEEVEGLLLSCYQEEIK